MFCHFAVFKTHLKGMEEAVNFFPRSSLRDRHPGAGRGGWAGEGGRAVWFEIKRRGGCFGDSPIPSSSPSSSSSSHSMIASSIFVSRLLPGESAFSSLPPFLHLEEFHSFILMKESVGGWTRSCSGGGDDPGGQLTKRNTSRLAFVVQSGVIFSLSSELSAQDTSTGEAVCVVWRSLLCPLLDCPSPSPPLLLVLLPPSSPSPSHPHFNKQKNQKAPKQE
jgi:hypothetical protein